MDEDIWKEWMLALTLSWPTCDTCRVDEEETVCADPKCWHTCCESRRVPRHHLPLSGVKGVKPLEGTSVLRATGLEGTC